MDIDILVTELARAKARFTQEDSFRVFHGRGQCFPGFEFLAIDFFKPTLLITIYRNPPDGVLALLSGFVETEIFNEDVSCLLVQRRDLRQYDLQLLAGKKPNDFLAKRKDLSFKLLSEQQNVGYFLDIEPARSWLEVHAAGKTILNLFAFTCSFSAVAIAAGARSLTNVDMNSNVLNVGRDNHRLNGLSTENVSFWAHEILRSWGKLIKHGPYDIVIVDPPSMQKGSFVALKDYPKVLRKLSSLLCEGGLALLCLNAPEVTREEFEALIEGADVPLTFQEALPANEDFPDKTENSLKMLVYRLELGLTLPLL